MSNLKESLYELADKYLTEEEFAEDIRQNTITQDNEQYSMKYTNAALAGFSEKIKQFFGKPITATKDDFYNVLNCEINEIELGRFPNKVMELVISLSSYYGGKEDLRHFMITCMFVANFSGERTKPIRVGNIILPKPQENELFSKGDGILNLGNEDYTF